MLLAFVLLFQFGLSHASLVDQITSIDIMDYATGLQRGTTSNPMYFGRTWSLISANDSVAATQSGTWTVQPGNTANTTPWLFSINQSGQTAVVKASSTAAATTDSALAVTLSPNGNQATASLQNSLINAVNAGSQDLTVNGTITSQCSAYAGCAATSFVSILTGGDATVTASVQGTFSAVWVIDGQSSDGVWTTLPGWNISVQPPTVATIYGTPAQISISSGGFTAVRIRVYSYASGTLNISLNASHANFSQAVSQLGSWNVSPLDGTKATYDLAVTNLVVATTAPTDAFCITGSASKTVRVLRIAVSGSQSTAGQRDILLIRRSTADTGGTSTSIPIVSHDTSNAAATATALAYTANPTLGTSSGTIRNQKIYFATTGGDSDNWPWEFGTRAGQAEVLRGTAQQICVNFNSTAGAGNLVNINAEITEE